MLPAIKTDIEIIFEKGGFFKGYKQVAKDLKIHAQQLQAELDAEREKNSVCKRDLAIANDKLAEIQEIILNP
ncbi:MAG: hypothetical protein ACRC6V_19610 [Bacteroidales bacterium]